MSRRSERRTDGIRAAALARTKVDRNWRMLSFYLAGVSVADIARHEGITPQRARTIVHREYARYEAFATEGCCK